AGGKLIGLTLVVSAIYVWIGSPLQAQAAAAGPTPEMNAINTAWTLIAAFLVFGMQVGFVMLEAGFARSRESVNILVEGIVDTCSTVTSGAMVGRCGFVGDILYSIGVTGFINPIIGHWSWGPDGWLATMQPLGFRDFAGSTVVHTIGGAISLVGAIALGPRLGRIFKRDGGGPMLPHNIILGAVGGLT